MNGKRMHFDFKKPLFWVIVPWKRVKTSRIMQVGFEENREPYEINYSTKVL